MLKKGISILGTLLFCLVSYGQYINVTKPPYYAIPNDGKDDSEGIQSAIDKNPGKTIFIPAGTFNIHKSIVVDNAVELVGEGVHNTVFAPLNCTGFLIKTSNVHIKNMSIKGDENGSNIFTGILSEGDQAYNISGFQVENVQLQRFNTGIELRFTSNAILDKVRIAMNPNETVSVSEGIRFYGKCMNNNVYNCYLSGELAAISIIRTKTMEEKARIENPSDPFDIIDLQSERAEGLLITNSFMKHGKYGVYSEGILRMSISNSSIDAAYKTAIDVTMTDGLLLSNNHIVSNSKSPNQVIRLNQCSDGNVANNYISTTANNTIGVAFENNSENCIVIGNIIKGTEYKTNHSSGSKNNVVINNNF